LKELRFGVLTKEVLGISCVLIENVHIIGPGKNSLLATTSSITTISEAGLTPSSFYIGGVDFNSVVNSSIRNLRIEEVSHYGIILGTSGQVNVPTTSSILLENLTILDSGHSESTFMQR